MSKTELFKETLLKIFGLGLCFLAVENVFWMISWYYVFINVAFFLFYCLAWFLYQTLPDFKIEIRKFKKPYPFFTYLCFFAAQIGILAFYEWYTMSIIQAFMGFMTYDMFYNTSKSESEPDDETDSL